jgi:hypothetical protein
MQMFILPFLLFIIVLGVIWTHDALYSASAGTSKRRRSTDGIRATIIPSKRDLHQFTYPSWPTSKPGPAIIFPPAGQKPHFMRTDQMMYEEIYDQEQGKPSFPPPLTRIVQENKTRIYIPGPSLQEGTPENEALERWLDDGGAA